MRRVKESHHPAQTRNQTHIQELINNQSALCFLLIKKATSVRRVRPNSGASRSARGPPSHMTIRNHPKGFDIGHVVHLNWREDGRSASSGPSGRSHQNELGLKNRIVPLVCESSSLRSGSSDCTSQRLHLIIDVHNDRI